MYYYTRARSCLRCNKNSTSVGMRWRWKADLCDTCAKELREDKNARKKWKKDVERILAEKADKALKNHNKEKKLVLTKKPPRKSKAFRKARALQNRIRKEKERKTQELIQRLAAEYTELTERYKDNNNVVLGKSMTLPWSNLPGELEDLVEHALVEKKYHPYIRKALSRAKRKGASLSALLKIKTSTELFDELGELESFKKATILWHGTKIHSLKGIFNDGFKLPRHSGLLGRGIYLAPDFDKAWNYSGWKERIILLCDVRLGKVMDSNKLAKSAEFETLNGGYHTAFHGAGKSKRAWGGRTRFSEYCVYEPIQVCPRYLLVFS